MGKRKMASNPGLDFYLETIDNADLADTTKRQYKMVLQSYYATGATLADVEALHEYAQSISKSSRANMKAAIQLLGAACEIQLKDGASVGTPAEKQFNLYRLEAVKAAAQVRAIQAEQRSSWLSASEVRQLLATCGDDLVGIRDWVVLALLVGTGMRAPEIIELNFTALREISRFDNEGSIFVIQIDGEGAKERTIPIDPILAERINHWHEIVGDGLIVRSMGRERVPGESASVARIVEIVRRHGAKIRKPYLAPLDLRRTFAQLSYEAGVSLIEITRLLGNSSILTTQRYINKNAEVAQSRFDFIHLA